MIVPVAVSREELLVIRQAAPAGFSVPRTVFKEIDACHKILSDPRREALLRLGELVLERATESPGELVIIHPDRDRELFDAVTADRAP